MSKKTLILAVILVLVALVGGVLWVAKEKSERMALEKVRQEEMAKETEKQVIADADFAKYNKVLSRDKITGVQNLEGPYKKVTVSNGEVTFSFEVPDKWLVETRNSGEVTMNEEELREFLGTKYGEDIRVGYSCKEVPIIDCLGSDDCSKGVPGTQKLCGKPYSDYADMDWGTLKSMSYQDMRKQLEAKSEFSPGFPNATVSSGMKNAIWYTDIGWDQVHFYVLDKTSDSQYIKSVTSFCYDTKCIQKDYFEYKENIEKKAERDKDGSVIVDKGEMRGFAEMIDLGDNKVLRIWKEAYVEGEFEDGFKHLIETFKFE